jgi:hypothetical protein
MKNRTLLLALLFSTVKFTSQTNISGTLSGSLTPQGSPYHVTGHIMVASNTTLTVMPGVVVQAEGHFKINVQGVLKASGTEQDSIFFRINPSLQNTGWSGIRFELTPSSQDSSLIEFCNISGGVASGTGDDIKGGAIYIRSFSKIRISHNLIHNNSAECGGGISLQGCNVLIHRNWITNNKATSDQFFVGGGGIQSDSVVSGKITNNEISYNSSLSFGGGGGLIVVNSTPIITGNNIHHNTVTSLGAGISYCERSAGTFSNNTVNYNSGGSGAGMHLEGSHPVISFNTIRYNICPFAGTQGGGIFVSAPAFEEIKVQNNIIAFNKSSNGGGLSLSSGELAISGNTIHGNYAETQGGAIVSGGIHCNLTNNIITNNTAGNGGGIYAVATTGRMNGNIIANNTAIENGGGLYLAAYLRITNCDIINNYANSLPSYTTSGYGGGGVFCASASNPTITNSIIWGNITQSGNGNQIYLQDNSSDPWIIHSNLQNGLQGIYTNGSVYSGSFTANQDTNPLFVVPSAGTGTTSSGLVADWRLQTNSPMINAGKTDTSGLLLPPSDIYGNLRVTGVIDQGVYESDECGTFSVGAAIERNGPTFLSKFAGSNYQWQDCNNSNSPISGAIKSIFTPTINGSYRLQITQFGCTANSDCESITNVGLKDNIAKKIIVYPNPSTGRVTLEGCEPGSQLSVLNPLGQIIYSFIHNNGPAEVFIKVSGLYFIQIESKSSVFTQKVVIK